MRSRDVFARSTGLVLLALISAAGLELLRLANGSGTYLGRFSSRWLAVLALYGVLAGIAGLTLGWTLWRRIDLYDRAAALAEGWLSAIGRLRWIVAVIFIALPSVAILGPWGMSITSPALRSLILIACVVPAGLALPGERLGVLGRLALGLLLSASLFTIAKRLIMVTDYPFKLGWSEGNRLWDYSLYFIPERYSVTGAIAYPAYLTPGRHGLWGSPFTIPGVSIEVVRLWDAMLWTAPYLLFGMVLFRERLAPFSTAVRWGLVLWAFLFLSQGPIYTPLVLSAILVVWGYDHQRPWRSAVALALACFYAGISRWTWLLAPAIWVVTWSLLDSDPGQPWWRRLLRPVAFGVVGLVGAAGSQVFMSWGFPRPDAVQSTALSQPLLWYRLWPSRTNPMGIVSGLIIAVGPLVALVGWARVRGWIAWDRLQWLGLVGASAVFLGAGLVASVKIGGGNNLHNLDMFLVYLVFVAGFASAEVARRVRPEFRSLPGGVQITLLLGLLVPAWMAVRGGGPLALPPQGAVHTALESIQTAVESASSEGEVLFMDQRQLLTFGQLEDRQMVIEYELKDLMNHAMGADKAYFEGFYADLSARRFRLILTHPQKVIYQGRAHAFGEENDAWVTYVTIPLLEHYRPVLELDEVGVWLLEPIPEG